MSVNSQVLHGDYKGIIKDNILGDNANNNSISGNYTAASYCLLGIWTMDGILYLCAPKTVFEIP